jgi:uncharacterized membrane protein
VNHTQPTSSTVRRIPFIDLARGIALVAMAIYHFTWDIEFFGWIAPSTSLTGGWMVFARTIASSFLFLVGISLVLAHRSGIHRRPFWKRWLQVVAAAATISLVTWFALPDNFIFFGILHAIALFSLVGLLLLGTSWLVPMGVAVCVVTVWLTFSHEVFSHPAFWWIGLAPTPPLSNDYVPLFPWFAAVAGGIGLGQLMQDKSKWAFTDRLALPHQLQRPLTFIGRHSLVFYLVHQPILLALVWFFTTFVAEPDRTPHFLSQCQTTCLASNSETFCQSYCNCLANELKRETLFAPLLRQSLDEEQKSRMLNTRDLCISRQP